MEPANPGSMPIRGQLVVGGPGGNDRDRMNALHAKSRAKQRTEWTPEQRAAAYQRTKRWREAKKRREAA